MPPTNDLSSNPQSTTRLWSLDLLRGLIILLMTLAHAIFFLHTHTNLFLNATNYLGDTVCFTILLFISSATSYITYVHLDHTRLDLVRRLGKRLLLYLIGY
jgi:uncharacterized membrane protein